VTVEERTEFGLRLVSFEPLDSLAVTERDQSGERPDAKMAADVGALVDIHAENLCPPLVIGGDGVEGGEERPAPHRVEVDEDGPAARGLEHLGFEAVALHLRCLRR